MNEHSISKYQSVHAVPLKLTCIWVKAGIPDELSPSLASFLSSDSVYLVTKSNYDPSTMRLIVC